MPKQYSKGTHPLCRPVADRFWPKVDSAGECWWWTAGTEGGYGYLMVDGRRKLAHRISWELHSGPIPEGMKVCHRCDHPTCVRPDHLFLGTHADNARDRHEKGRDARGASHFSRTKPERVARGERHNTQTHPELIPRGEAHHQAKLTDDDVREIRRLYALGARQIPLAAQFGVRQGTISTIVRRQTWQHLE